MRRRLLIQGLLGAGLLALAACGSGAPAAPLLPAVTAAPGTPLPPPQPSAVTRLGPPPPLNRIEQTLAWSAHNAAWDFRIVALEVRKGRELLVFYAMHAALRGVPIVTAHSAGGPPTGPATGTPLPVTAMQPLGALAEFDTGVIHVGWRDPIGPQIVLDVQPPGRATPAWQVTPVQQITS